MKKLLVTLALCAFGCSPHTQDHGPVDFAVPGGGDDMSASGGGGAGGGDMSGPLVIAPMDPVLTMMPGGMPTQGFTATIGGQAVSPAWTIDRGELGNIDVSTGVFTAAGTIGGKGTITAMFNGQTATTSITLMLQQTQNGDPAYPPSGNPGPGGYGGVGGHRRGGAAGSGSVGVLGGASTPNGTVKILYPYDGTVWPRGLLAPLIMWDQAALKFDAIMIKLHSKYFDYTGTFAA